MHCNYNDPSPSYDKSKTSPSRTMASNYEKPPVFSKDRLWTEKDLKSLEKYKFQGNHNKKAEVPIEQEELKLTSVLVD